ncbi:MAG: hypothetical protein V4484_24035 [Pseudomonadota bacterium]
MSELLTTLENKRVAVGTTNELNGTYKGAVLLKTNYYLAQLDEATGNAIIHNRLMLDTGQKGIGIEPPTYAQNESLTIHYSPEKAPRVERHKHAVVASPERRHARNTKPKGAGR